MGPSGRITHVMRYIGYIALFGTGICRFCIWVELPVQRTLCPIFVRNVGSPDIHECFRGLTGSQRTPGFGVSHLSRSVRAETYPVYHTDLHAQFVVPQRRHAPSSLRYRIGSLSPDPNPCPIPCGPSVK